MEDGEVVGALWGGSHFSGTHGGHREAHQTTYRDPQKHLKPRPFRTTYLKPRPLVIKQDYDNENKNMLTTKTTTTMMSITYRDPQKQERESERMPRIQKLVGFRLNAISKIC